MKTLDHTVHATSGSAGRLDEGDAGRHRHHLPDRHGHARGVPATGEQGAHLVADRPALDALAELGDPAAALEADDVGGAGRRRVEALPLQGVGPVDRRGDDVDQHLAGGRASGRRPRRRTGPRAPGPGGDDGAHGISPRRGRWSGRPPESSGTSSSMSSGSGASAGRSQLSASAWARAASRSICLGVGVAGADRDAEEVGRDRRRRLLHVLAATRARSRTRPSSTSVSTSSTSHSSSIQSWRFTSPMSRTPTRRAARELDVRRRRSRRSAQESMSTRLLADRRHLGEVQGGEQAVQRHPVLPLQVGSHAAEPGRVEHPGQLPPAVGVDEERPVAAHRRLAQAPHRRRASRAACRPPARRRAAGARSSASTPVSSPATGPPRGGSSRTKVTGRAVGTVSGPTTTTSSASRNASTAYSSSVRPASSTDALSIPSIRAAVPPARTTPQKPPAVRSRSMPASSQPHSCRAAAAASPL